jgi:hypothetical protein
VIVFAVIKFNLNPNFKTNIMKKAFFLIFLFLGLTVNAQTFAKEKFNKPIDLIKITTIKKRILGIETTENFMANKDSVLAKYNRKAIGDESVSYEFLYSFFGNRYGNHVSFYVYDWETFGKLDSSFNLSDGYYTFEFYSKNKIVKSFIGLVKRCKIIKKIDTTSQFDYENNFPEN